MADKFIFLRDDNGIRVRYEDNGDGTWSLAQSASAKAAALGYLPAGTNRSGSITAANTSQTLAAANTTRKYLGIQNTSTGDLWIDEFGNDAVLASPSFRIAAGGSLNVRTNAKIAIIGATAGQTWSATET